MASLALRACGVNIRDKQPLAVPGKRTRELLSCVLAVWLCAPAYPAGPAEFSGRVVLEVLDDIELDHKLRLLEDFAFRDKNGRVWTAPRGGVIDGTSLPRALRLLPGLPPETEFRKASVLHDYHSRARVETWREVRRMLHSASLHEGLGPTEAKLLYAAVYAAGWRWEPRTSTCYRSCHAASTMLAWQPDVTQDELRPVLDWLRETDPSLDEIEQRVDAVTPRPGPHLFVQVRQRNRPPHPRRSGCRQEPHSTQRKPNPCHHEACPGLRSGGHEGSRRELQGA